MGDVTITPQDMSSTPFTATRTALSTANTYYVPLGPGGVVLNFIKTGAGAATITVVTPNTDPDGNAVADKTFSVAATTGDVVGIFRPEVYANGDGNLVFTTDEDTAITVAAFRKVG